MQTTIIKYLLPGLITALAAFLFLYGLGNTSLHPWDEAWYATISRNLFRSGNLSETTFNGAPFWDHPPLGYYAMALSYYFFGISEFSARLPMALCAMATTLVLYFTGSHLGNRAIGVSSALIFLSSRWMLLRGRTGNLEPILVLTQSLLFYLAFTATKPKHLPFLWFVFALTLLSKSAISLTLFPLVLLPTFVIVKHTSFKLSYPMLIGAFFAFVIPLLPWYGYNIYYYGSNFLRRNLLTIGLRNASSSGVTQETLTRTLLYLRSAIHKWYLPLIAAIPATLISFRERAALWVLAYLFFSAFPYFVSSQSHIWHLLPIVPPMALIIPLSAYLLINRYFTKFQSFLIPAIPLVTLIIALVSWKSFWHEFLNLPPQVSNEAAISKATTAHNLPVLLQDDTYMPTVVFYADRPVKIVLSQPEYLTSHPKPFQVITKTYLLQDLTNYKIVYQNGDSVIAIFE